MIVAKIQRLIVLSNKELSDAYIVHMSNINILNNPMNHHSQIAKISSNPLNDPHLISSPRTELAQRALKDRIWLHASSGNTTPPRIVSQAISNVLTQINYAWCAGFLDGEGCISLARIKRNCGNGVNYRVKVTIPQNCKETLLTFREYIGENCFIGLIAHREYFTRPMYQLVYDGIHASNMLHKLRPYLIRKGAEADVIFDFYKNGQPTRHFGPKGAPSDIWHLRERCFEALRCLK